MRILAVTLFVLCTHTVLSQGKTPAEGVLLAQFRKITYWADYRPAGDADTTNAPDSLFAANDTFSALLLKYAGQPGTLSSSLQSLEAEGLAIATSPDGLFRIYSWDTYTGSTMHYFDNVFQYRVGGKLYAKSFERDDEGDPGCWYSEIYSVIIGGKTYYLGVQNAKYSTSDAYEGVKAFTIANNRLDDSARLFRTRTGIKNTLGFGFNFFSVVERPERPLRLLEFNPASKTLSLPVVLENGRVTGRRIVYRFTGRFFERVK